MRFLEDKRNTEYQMHTGHIQLEQVLPAEIENRSFEIIQDELAAMGKVLDPVQDLLIRRAIHTTADFDYADNLVFSCLLYTSPSPRDGLLSRMPSSA